MYGSSGSIRSCNGIGCQIRVLGDVVVEIKNCDISNVDFPSLFVESLASVTADSSIFSSNSFPIGLMSMGHLTARYCHILSEGGPSSLLVKCFSYPIDWTVIDLKNCYWGDISADEIAAGIWDGNDDSSLKVVVEFEPHASGPVPVEKTSWGDVKSMFR